MVYPGADFSTFLNGLGTPSMDLSFTPIGGAQAARETILRKLRTPPGSFDDATWGLDLAQYQNAALGPSDLQALQGRVAAAIEDEEYVAGASVECILANGVLVVDCSVDLVDGESFTMAFALTPAGIRVIVGP